MLRYSLFWSVAIVYLKQQRNPFYACFKLIKLITLRTGYQNSLDKIFRCTNRLCFYNDILSCAAVLLHSHRKGAIQKWRHHTKFIFWAPFPLPPSPLPPLLLLPTPCHRPKGQKLFFRGRSCKIHFVTYVMLHIINLIINRWLKR